MILDIEISLWVLERLLVMKSKHKQLLSLNVWFVQDVQGLIVFRGVCWSPFAIVMEFCAGGPLYRVLRDSSAVVTPILIIEWARQIASAMQYLHIQNIVHRDLKSPKWVVN